MNAGSARRRTRTFAVVVMSGSPIYKMEGITCHTFAKSFIDSGVSLDKVATLLGHSNLYTTRIYTTPGVQDLEDAINGLSNFLRSALPSEPFQVFVQ